MITTKLLTVILAGVPLITAAASARGDDYACPVAAPAKLQIRLARGAEHVDADISLRQVREAANGHHPGPILGLYVVASIFHFPIRWFFGQNPSPQGQVV
jgi:hypothetical protein